MKNSMLECDCRNAGNCVNLRPGVEGDDEPALVPVLSPGIISRRPWHTLGLFEISGDEVVEVLADDVTVGARILGRKDVGSSAGVEPWIVGTIAGGKVTGVYRQDDSRLVVLTTQGKYRIAIGGDKQLSITPCISCNDYPALMMYVDSESSYSQRVGGFRLSGEYGSGSVVFDANDTATLNSRLTEAYCSGSRSILAGGGFTGPVLARYRLYDKEDDLLFESVPKLIVPTGRHDMSLTATLGVDVADRQVASGQLVMPNFKITLRVPAAKGTKAEQEIARVDVQLTPQLHILDETLDPVHRINLSAGSATVRATVPGYSDAQHTGARYSEIIRKALSGADELFQTVLSVYNPYEAGSGMQDQYHAVEGKTALVADEIKAVAKCKTENVMTWEARCRVPHNVSPGVGVRECDITVVGNLRVELYKGSGVEYLINHAVGEDAVEMVATVSFDDGRRVVHYSKGLYWNRMSLTPLIAYPDPSARSIELFMCDSLGNNHYLTVPLRRCGRYACYISPDVLPVDLEENHVYEFYIPKPAGTVMEYRGHVIAQRDGDEACARRLSNGTVTVVRPVVRATSSAWESTRVKFYIMGSDGIKRVAVINGKLAAAVTIDKRSVEGYESVARCNYGGKINTTYVIVNRKDIVIIDENRVKTLGSCPGAEMMVWDDNHNELIIMPRANAADVTTTTQAMVYHSDYDGWSERVFPRVIAVYSDETAARITTVDGLHDAGSETVGPVECMYRALLKQHVKHPVKGLPFVSEIVVGIVGSAVNGDVDITGDNGHGEAALLSRLHVEGEVMRPLVHYTMMPPRLRLYARWHGKLSPDARITRYQPVYGRYL